MVRQVADVLVDAAVDVLAAAVRPVVVRVDAAAVNVDDESNTTGLASLPSAK